MTATNAIRAVTCALAVLGCALGLQAQVVQQRGEQAQQPQQPQQPQPAPLQQLQQPKPKVVATVNKDPITEPELENTYTRNVAALQQQGQQIDAKTAQQVRKQTLDGLVESRLVEQYVIDKGPDIKKEEVEETLGQVKKQVRDQGASFKGFLAAQGMTEKTFEQRVKGSLAWQKYQQESLTEPKLQEYFQQNKERFQAEEFEQAMPEVVQAYTSSIWQEIVKEMRPKAKIEVMEKPAETRPPAQSPIPGQLPPRQ